MEDLHAEDLDVRRIWDDAVELLGRIGLKVENGEILRRLGGRLPVEDGWVRFPPEMLADCAEELRRLAGTMPVPSRERGIVLANSSLNYFTLDPETDERKPYDYDTLVRHTKLACRLKDEGLLIGGATGYPLDAPPGLQLLIPTYLECVYNRQPRIHGVIHNAAQLRVLVEIAELFGLEALLGTEPISPMRFAGDSVDIAYEQPDPGIYLGVDPMPILGITAPMDWHLGFAQSVAENVGSYLIYRLSGFENVGFPSFRLFVPNLRAGMIYFSSPKHILALLARRKVREFFGASSDYAEMLLVTAKRPDAQAAAEKMAACLLARTHGFRYLGGAGSLWLDSIFSPAQLLIDLEIARYVNAIEADFTPPSADAVEVVRRGLEEGKGGFLADEMTLEGFEAFLWRPSLYDLSPPGDSRRATFLQRARELADAKAAAYDYELTGPRREELERIMDRARRELS